MTTAQKKTIVQTGTLLGFFITFFFLLLLSTAYAEIAPYTPLVSIPGLTNQKMASLPDYLNKVYFLIITIGALYGVVKIAFAGVKYSLSDVITSKESAKGDIKGVLLGLAILLIPFIVLQTINPDLTRLDVLSNAKNMRVDLKTTPQKSSSYSPSATDIGTTKNFCTDGSYNAATGGCDLSKNTIDQAGCTDYKGTYDTNTKVCTLPTKQPLCSDGTYNTATRGCDLSKNTIDQAGCTDYKGTYDTNTKVCTVPARTQN